MNAYRVHIEQQTQISREFHKHGFPSVLDTTPVAQHRMIYGPNIQGECATKWPESVTPWSSDWITEDNVFVREALIYVGGPVG